ncbi:MAG: Rne/Rng family ribonuclease [Micropruina glycogenica]
MLDEETPTSTADDASAEVAAPPRRRRSASRPAGPPAPVSEPVASAEPEADEPEVAEPQAVQPDTTEPEPEPDATDVALELEPDATDVALELEAEQPIVVDLEADETPAEPEANAELQAVPAPDERVEQPDDVPFTLELPEEKPAPRRRRSTRAAKAPEPVIEVVDVVTEAAETPAPLSLDELPTLDDLAPAAAAPRARRRRAKAEPKPEPVTDTDPIEETLGELTRSGARSRRIKVDEAEAAKALDELAAMIGGHAEPEAELDDEVADPTAVLDSEPNAAAADERAADADDEPDDTDADDTDEGSPRRRRRRRGGRRRRRGGSTETAEGDADENDDDDSSEADDEDGAETAAEADGAEGDAAEAGESTGSTRRRRRRRRRGEDTTGAEDDPSDVVVRVREPRRSRTSNDDVTGIDGSTRMEAKRQRRREGRAAGRRRSPILSESEFLARRESVDRSMLIRQADDYTQIAVLEDGILVEHYVDRASAASMIGNVYLGKVQNVLPSMEAAFIDIGRGRNAVLYAGEVDWDAFGVTGADRKMEKVFKSGQSVLVQVTKDPIGAKGARLTAHVSIPGRYVVYSPSGQLSGISRKLPEGERNRLKGILEELVGDAASVIVRTAAEGASEDELVRDVNRLKAQWEVIEKKVKAGKSPEQLYAEPDLTVRIVRDLFTEDFGTLIVDGNGKGEDAFDTVDAYVTHVAPHLKERLQHWNRAEQGDLFDQHRINEQIAKALERKVFLPSGGSLIIDRTEAMTVIDVNTGKFTGTSGNLEATVTSNNLEAAEEVVRQLRLRDIGGIIVIDFIDMVLPANRELLLRRLVECLGRDRTRHQVAEVTSLGLVQMTRKRIGTGLAEAFTVTCETCHGRGYHRHDTPVDTQAPADGGDRDHGRRRR